MKKYMRKALNVIPEPEAPLAVVKRVTGVEEPEAEPVPEVKKKTAVEKAEEDFAAAEAEVKAAEAEVERLEAKSKKPAKAVEEKEEEEEEPKAVKKEVAPYIKALKVGDTITYGKSSHYMGDGGDSRDVAYQVDGKITKIERGVYYVEGRYTRSEEQKFRVTASGLWMTGGGKYTSVGVYAIGKQRLTEAIREKDEEGNVAAFNARYRSKEALGRADKKAEADWTKGTNDYLRDLLEKHFTPLGKRVANLKIMKKDKLIELIRKHKIRE